MRNGGARFEAYKQRIGLWLGPVAAVVAYVATDAAHTPALPALLALCLVWWVAEALPPAVVALLGAVGAVIFGLATPAQAFAAFGKPQLFLFVGSFFMAEAMRIHGLGERVARIFIARARGQLSLLTWLGATTFVLSMAMSNAAATAIVLPIALSAAGGTGARFRAALVLMVAWAASVGGLATPVGTPPNLFGKAALAKLGVELGFMQWMAITVPITVLMFGGLVLVLRKHYAVAGAVHGALPGALPGGANDNIAHAASVAAAGAPSLSKGGTLPLSPGERSVLVVMAVAVVGWLTPSLVDLIGPGSALAVWCKAHLSEEVVALAAAALLFVLPGGLVGAQAVGGDNAHRVRRPALTWDEATEIEWGVILLFGGGILLGDLANTHGLSARMGQALMAYTHADSTLAITALVTGVAILLSEATSNTATATLMTPLAAELAHAAGAAPVPCVLGATLGASFGFMMPISTAPNALAFATGHVTMAQMMRSGVVFDVFGFLLIVAGLRLMCPLLGWW